MSESRFKQFVDMERRHDTEQRLDFDDWLQVRKEIGHLELMNMSAEEHQQIRGEYANDLHWHAVRMKRPEPIYQERFVDPT